MLKDEITLSPVEVIIVRGWFECRPLAEIAAEAETSRQRLAQMIRHMRRRGVALPERANSWRTTRKQTAVNGRTSIEEGARG